MASSPPLPNKRLQYQTENILCWGADCVICAERRFELRNRQRQFDIDHLGRNLWRPWECDSCTWYFRRGGCRQTMPHWVLHETFLDLESSARIGCRSCRLFRQAIIYNSPSTADLWALRFQRRPIWIRLWGPEREQLRIEYGRYPMYNTIELTKNFAAPVQPESDARAILDIAYRLLDTCGPNSSHTMCTTAKALHLLPTRVVDVGDNDTPPSLYLSEGRSARYCTLSYTWGVSGGWFNTTSDNIIQRTRSLPLVLNGKPIPKTYHDAIIIVRSLGIRYVWIDALCIIQNDPDDWLRESAKMMDIYQNSYCTIAATGNTHVEEGILNLRAAQYLNTSETAFGSERPEIKYFDRHLRATTPEKRQLVRDAPLSTRGWVLQEMVLSPRILHFTPHCLYFDCLSRSLSEVDQVDDSQPSQDSTLSFNKALIDLKKCHPSTGYYLWWDVLREYTGKDLTREEDRLPAISGIANRIQITVNDCYVAGLWRNNLVQDLQWFVHPEHFPGKKVVAKRPKAFIAPSWSWASIIGPISSAKEPMDKWSSCWDQEAWYFPLEIVDVKVDLVNVNNSYGQVASRLLRVLGRLRAARLSSALPSALDDDGFLAYCEGPEVPRLKRRPNVIKFDIVEEYSEPSNLEDLWCLEVYRCIKDLPEPVGPDFYYHVYFHALVLRPTRIKTQYQRVGFAKITSKSYFDSCKAQSVDIV